MALSRGLEGLSTHLEQRVDMTVTYNAFNCSTRVKNGILMRAEMIIFQPTVVVEGGEAESLFTLVMTERVQTRAPDQCTRYYVKWVVSDIVAAGTLTGEETNRRNVVGYLSPTAEGFHRYVFCLFKQQMGRRPFSAREFMWSNDNLINILGASPVAFLYFYTVVPRMAEVVGDHVMDSFDHRLKLFVRYDDFVLVPNGHFLTAHQVRSQPNVEIFIELGDGDHQHNVDLFTLVMIDRVGLSPNPDRTEFLHWLVTDIPAGRPVYQPVTRMQYTSPNPGRWVNTYMFVLFKQTRWLPVTITPELPHEFSTRKFAVDNNLGAPVAAVWFIAG